MKEIQDVINARICCYDTTGSEEFDCHHCPYENENKGGLECSQHLQNDMFAYLKKYLNDIQRGTIRKTAENKWGQWEIAGHLGRYEPMCGICGSIMHSSYRYCPYCGTKIKWKKLKNE